MRHNGHKINLIDRRGDRGKTSLYSGERVSKSSLRPEALGDVDELNSILGLARYHAKKRRIKKEILQLQKDLFVVGSALATTQKKRLSLPIAADGPWLKAFEKKVQSLHDVTRIPKGFVIPGKNLCAAYLHHARTVARRCERRVVRVFERERIKNKFLLAWLNRLSVYLFLMAQHEDSHPTLK